MTLFTWHREVRSACAGRGHPLTKDGLCICGAREGKWQHRVPQGTDEMHEEEVYPAEYKFDGELCCAHCGKPIIRVDENEGPEALKSMLRL